MFLTFTSFAIMVFFVVYRFNNKCAIKYSYTGDTKRKPLAPVICSKNGDGYELSQEIIDKKVEMLVRKYGKKSIRAALIIQQAFRKYEIKKRFKNITLNAMREKSKINQTESYSSQPRTKLKRYSNSSLQSSSSSSSTATSSSNNTTFFNRTSSITSNNSSYSLLNGYHLTNVNMPRSPTMPSLQSPSTLASNKHVQIMQTSDPLARPALATLTFQSITNAQVQFDLIRKREYRVGMNFFNKQPPERGINFLFEKGFIEEYVDESRLLPTKSAEELEEHRKAFRVAHFLLTRKGLSKQMIGEYLGDLQSSFNQLVLKYFVKEMDFSGMVIDAALRKFQTYFRFPGKLSVSNNPFTGLNFY